MICKSCDRFKGFRNIHGTQFIECQNNYEGNPRRLLCSCPMDCKQYIPKRKESRGNTIPRDYRKSPGTILEIVLKC